MGGGKSAGRLAGRTALSTGANRDWPEETKALAARAALPERVGTK
jgi:hypothetical protein